MTTNAYSLPKFAGYGCITHYACPECGASVPRSERHQCGAERGCICPPGANLTCEAAECPRKAGRGGA